MNCVEIYFEMIRNIEQPGDERNAFSQLDHQLQYDVGMESALELLKENVCDKYDVPQKYKVYIAALAEYIYHRCNVEPPKWVYEEQFYLSEPIFSEGVIALCKRSGKNTLKKYAIKDALPEFKKRNYMITDVLSAI